MVTNAYKIKLLVDKLNKYRDLYYNENTSKISDEEYDKLFDELKELENETGIIYSNSPTQSVGYDVKSKLKKVKHNHPMLSLDKTKSEVDLVTFFGDRIGLLMHKMDGLTISLRYLNGELISAETRGNGEIGEDILHNAKVFSNIPLHINCKDEVIIDGEAIIDYKAFTKINNTLPEDKKYKNPRNLASGSVRQLDSNIAASRNIKFIAWKLIKGYDSNSFVKRLDWLSELGFEVVCYSLLNNRIYDDSISYIHNVIENLKMLAEKKDYPIDGLVASYDDIAYGESLGATGHHIRSQLAFKFYDETAETKILNVDWTMGKSGSLTPTAIFAPVELDGTIVERASLHNVNIFKSLNLYCGDTVLVYKANQIIPQILENLDKFTTNKSELARFYNPHICPCCGSPTFIRKDNDSEVLYCSNDNCRGKLLGKLTHFVSKNAMNIDGLSESTLEKFINLGYLNSFIDIYKLNEHYNEIIKLEGFGKRSADKLMVAIENSKHTTLDRFIYALCIPLIGRTASKTISKHFNGNFNEFYKNCVLFPFNFEQLEDFGYQMALSMDNYLKNNYGSIEMLAEYMTFEIPQITNTVNSNLAGKTFVITGSLNKFANRKDAIEKIESLGGKVSGSVSKKTDYLVNNDINFTSGKNKKAKEIGIPIITEEELINMF